jgi:hypothetical protein
MANVVGNKTITSEQIARVTANLPPARADKVIEVLSKYQGETWRKALDEHSREKKARASK